MLTLLQLKEAKVSLDKATTASQTHSQELLQQAEAYKKQQSDIDRRLMIVTQSETSDDAIREFDTSMRSLQLLELAQGYTELLSEVERLRYRGYLKDLEAQPLNILG